MAMRVSKANNTALTVSADNLIVRYDLSVGGCATAIFLAFLTSPQRAGDTSPDTTCAAHRTKYAGNSSIAIRDDDKVCAVGGWDGRYVAVRIGFHTSLQPFSIRLYATRTMKPLGTLKYHKTGCQVLEFA